MARTLCSRCHIFHGVNDSTYRVALLTPHAFFLFFENGFCKRHKRKFYAVSLIPQNAIFEYESIFEENNKHECFFSIYSLMFKLFSQKNVFLTWLRDRARQNCYRWFFKKFFRVLRQITNVFIKI
jgi:hypothetical protein